jgi:hypothetical protein
VRLQLAGKVLKVDPKQVAEAVARRSQSAHDY